MPDEIGDPGEIAQEIVGELREALGQIEDLERDLGTPAVDAGLGSWVVFLADQQGEDGRPAIVEARNRWAAERDVSLACRVSQSKCYAVPADLSSSIVGAMPLEQHPLRHEAPTNLGDMIELQLKAQVDEGNERLLQLREIHANLLGCTLDELEAKLAAEKAERELETAARRAESKARRLPAPRRSAAKAPPGAPAIEAGMRTLTDRQRELLALVDVDPKTNRVVYTRDEHVPDWAALKQAVEALGGRWVSSGRKTKGGWLFSDELDAMDAIRVARESGQILDPKLFGFFATSDEVADALVRRLEIAPGARVLEPSAGDGPLVRAVLHRAQPAASVACVELLPANREKLVRQGFELIGHDFLQLDPGAHEPFDVVVANPPFGKGRQEIHHVLHMLRFLRVGGALGAILPTGIQHRDDTLTTDFRAELYRHGAVIEPNPDGSFRDAGTMVRTVSMWLRKVGSEN